MKKLILVLFVLGSIAKAEPALNIHLPPGFKIEVYVPQVEGARSLALGTKGTLFVGTMSDRVYAITPDKKIYTLAKSLNQPNGVAFRDGSLYVAEINRIIKFENVEEHLKDSLEYKVLNDTYPSDKHHGWKFIAFGPDGKLYVPIGAPCNICEIKDPYAAITRLDKDAKNREIFARGVRNTVGFDWHPVTHELWFTDNGRDMLGDDSPPDELNRAAKIGLHFGFPYCHGGDILDPEFGKNKKCADYEPPVQKLGPHVASLGMRFYTGNMFPAEYKNQIIIAEHGSWNRSTKIGYRLSLVKLDSKGKATSYERFAEGWLQPGDKVVGRPVDVVVAQDGAILVSDDFANQIYRISYKK